MKIQRNKNTVILIDNSLKILKIFFIQVHNISRIFLSFCLAFFLQFVQFFKLILRALQNRFKLQGSSEFGYIF